MFPAREGRVSFCGEGDTVGDIMYPYRILQGMLGAFLIGVALASWLVIPAIMLWLVLLLAGICMAIRRPKVMVCGCVLASLLLGLWRTSAVIETPSVLWNLSARKQVVTLEGYADGDATPASNQRTQWPFHVIRVRIDDMVMLTDDRVMVFAAMGAAPRYGQILSITGKLQQPKNAGDFDYVSYLSKEGIHALMYFPEYDVPDGMRLPWAQLVRIAIQRQLYGVRDHIAAAITRAVRQPEASYLVGILVGAKGTISAEMKDAFARTGTSHIITISGYNITIIASVLALLCAPLGRRRAFIAVLVGIGLFTLLTGASASVVRAALMGVLALSAQQVGRTQNTETSILLAASLMCAYNPLILRWDIGFQLSFLALIGIVYIEPLVRPTIQFIFRYASVANVAATTLAAQIAVLPLLLYDFGQLPVYGLPVNLLVLPLVPLAMALAVLTAGAGIGASFAGLFFGQLAWLVAAFQLLVIQWFSHLPYAAPEVHVSALATVIAYSCLVGFLVLYYRKNHVITQPLSS